MDICCINVSKLFVYSYYSTFSTILKYFFLNSHASHGSGKSGRFRAKIVFLDDTYHIFDLDKKAKGSALIEV